MKNFICLFFILIALTNSQNAFSQVKNCSFQLDTNAIISNKNLLLFIEEFKKDTFYTLNNKKVIPKKTLKLLKCYEKEFKLANPNEDFQSGCVVTRKLPSRKLTFLAKSNHFLIMKYLIGGVGVSGHLLIVKYNDENIVDIWKGFCYSDISSIKEVTEYIKQNLLYKEKLNYSELYF